MAKGFGTKAIIYIRVSTEEQQREGVSLSMQEARLREYCASHNLDVVEVIADAGVSGGKFLGAREGGQRALALLRAKKATHIVALKLDRLFRNAGDALTTIDTWDKSGVTTHLLDFMGGQHLDTRSPMGRMMLGVVASFAQFERDLISQRTKDALQHKKKKREAYSPTPYGYVRVGNQLLPDPREQEGVGLMQRLRRMGMSLRRICAELVTLGFSPKSGCVWHPYVVSRILNNDIHVVPSL
jgi:DNA invertase Pin-like site-specific DNA recombinase